MVEKYFREFLRRVKLSWTRMNGETYRGDRVFREKEYDWEGDWEGRVLLAFVCLKRLTGKQAPALSYEIKHLREHTNEYGYFGRVTDGNTVSEQLLSGNGWYLRGLCEYYCDTGEKEILELIQSIVKNLYLRCETLYDGYPVADRIGKGGVSGILSENRDGWILSTDIGCAFIALDGLTAAYGILRSEKLKIFIDKQIFNFLSLDKTKCHMQTHATLTVCRAIIRMYRLTDDKAYLNAGRKLFDFYVNYGMTLTYENFNWFGREETWTEPCAVIDSLIAALYLYRELRDGNYLTLARRIYFNGLNLCQRNNGGAGTNSCVTSARPYWSAQMYEAEFCCSMRMAEGLYQISLFKEELFAESDDRKEIVRDEYGRYFKGDHLLCCIDGGTLTELPKIFQYSRSELCDLRLKICFKEGR